MKQWKKNFIRTIPVLTGYLVLGASFGIVMQSKGFGVLWSIGMSAAVFAGSMQFVAVDLLATAAGIITTALTTLMVNARHLFYGVSMVDRYRDVGKAKPYLIFALTDETYSIVCADETLSNRDLLQITLLDHLYWIAGSAIGGGIGALRGLCLDAGNMALAAFLLGWGGLSVLLQSRAVLAGTPLGRAPLARSKLLHGLLSAAIAWLLWQL